MEATDPKGKPSVMRWIAKRVFWMAAITNAAALVGWLFLGRAGAVEIIASASGMLALVVGAKAWQRTVE